MPATTTIVPAAEAIVPVGTWNIDPSHSSIGFSIKHMMIATVRGRFTGFSGALEADENGRVTIGGVVQAASIDTNEAQRDEHLRSPDFLDAARYPEIRFDSTRVEPAGHGEYRIVGDLTIRGTTREVSLRAEVHGAGTDPWGNERIALEATGDIDRRDFGLNWNQLMETGGVLVGDRVKLTLDLSTVKSDG